jgi:DNA-binding response OmpR family regulator
MDVTSYGFHSEAWQNNTILLLDPDEAIQMLYRDELNEEGYEVIPVNETARVMKYIETYKPTLLIMETGLYGRNGLRVLQDIRTAHPELPVIVCTADPSFKAEPMTRIADEVVLKGMSTAELNQSIWNVLRFRALVRTEDTGYPLKLKSGLKQSRDIGAHPDIADQTSRTMLPSSIDGNGDVQIKEETL